MPTVGSNSGFTATQTYTYDNLNRIKDATETISSTQTWKQTFQYDRYGNRNFDEANTTTLPKNCTNNAIPVVCTADRKVLNPSISTSTNRIVLDQDNDNQNDYTFDNSGNTTKDATSRTFVYDAENKQIEVKNASNVTIGQYWYDGDGKRVKKYVPSTSETTIFIYEASGKLVEEYSTIVESTQNAKVGYLTNDHLGSPRINTDRNGAVTSRHDYHPFGEEILTSQRTSGLGYADDTVRKQFTGYERDGETDLDFAQARMYGYGHGRFTSPDPLMASAKRTNPQSWNRYTYVLNNPHKYVDPSGMIWGRRWNGTDYTYRWFEGSKVPKGWKSVSIGTIVDQRDGGFVILGELGSVTPAVSLDIPGAGQKWVSQKDAEAINDITGGALCSLSAGLFCPNAGNPTADKVAAASDVVQFAFLIKSLLKAGVSLAAIAMILKKNPDDIAKIAAETIGKGYALGQCLECAKDLLAAFKKAGYEGKLVKLVSETGTPIFKAGEEAGRPIADAVTGHYGVQVGDLIYEMNSTKGIPIAEWAKRYTTGGLDANGRLTTLVPPVIKEATLP